MDENRLIDIETKLAHQENLLEELNRVLTSQQSQISALEDLCRRLVERMRSLGDDGGRTGAVDDERPPHY